jgi:hypothetical protein
MRDQRLRRACSRRNSFLLKEKFGLHRLGLTSKPERPRQCAASNNAARGALSRRHDRHEKNHVWMGAAPVTPVGECSRADHGLYRGDIGIVATSASWRHRRRSSPTRVAWTLFSISTHPHRTAAAGIAAQ